MSSQKNNSCLFIYGTLKRGQSRAGSLAGQKLLGESKTVARYRMFDCGSYPGLVQREDGLEIAGEVWSVNEDCLHQLDLIEAVDQGLYQRTTIQLKPPFDSHQVQSYFYLLSVEGLPDCGDCWTSDF